jgi:hypothetical protein
MVNTMLTRAVIVWCAILGVAFVNGATRELWLIPRLGTLAGQIVSSVALCVAILAVAWAVAAWISIPSTADALQVGVLWLVLTAAFEFGAGHYLFGRPWSVLLEDYSGTGALIRVPMLVTTLVAPVVAASCRGLLRGA